MAFLVASVVFNWLHGPRDAQGHTRPGMSTDPLAVVAYPVFAATDLLVQAIRMVGTEHRALAIFCLRHPAAELDGFGELGHTPLRLAEIPPDILSLGQRVVEMTGPLALSYVFADVCFVLAISVVLADKVPWRPSPAAKTYLLIGYAYVVLALVIFHLSLGALGISIIIFIYEAVQPFLLGLMIGTGWFLGRSSLFLLFCCIAGLVRRDWAMMIKYAQHLGWCLFASLAPIALAAIVVTSRTFPIPDLAVTIDERDQLAVLIAGLVALGYTVFNVFWPWDGLETEAERGMEEMQGLTVVEEDGTESEVGDFAQGWTFRRIKRAMYDDRMASHGRSITF
jgi:hypothetical protein